MPVNTKDPIKHNAQDKTVNNDGFFLVEINTITGTTTHERFSKKAYLVGVVYKSPIFCTNVATDKNIPVGTAVFI
jgi:hypothetical protein